jgi:hypothetical protein
MNADTNALRGARRVATGSRPAVTPSPRPGTRRRVPPAYANRAR